MVYVANDGRYIIKDRSITNSTDLSGDIEITYPMDNFPCDDLIAPAVAELLKRGYQTKYCCQGHIAPDLVNDISTVHGTDIPIVENFEVFSTSNMYAPYIMFENLLLGMIFIIFLLVGKLEKVKRMDALLLKQRSIIILEIIMNSLLFIEELLNVQKIFINGLADWSGENETFSV